MDWTQQDMEQFGRKGIPLSAIEEQLERFRTGFSYTRIDRPATPGDGILRLSKAEQTKYVALYETESGTSGIIRFIPASGAASRMFKDLFAARDQLLKNRKSTLAEPVISFFKGLDLFAFRDALGQVMHEKGLTPEALKAENDLLPFLENLLDPSGLDYGNRPKGQILFHRYPEKNRTAFEEHLVESVAYAQQDNREIHHHFTVSPQHISGFEEILLSVRKTLEQHYGVSYCTSFSVQKPSTDTIAVDIQNNPFRIEDGTILFRPGGHGALIENLNDLDTDLVFLKNIDNVAPDHLKPDTYYWKKVLGGVLLSVRKQLFRMQRLLDQDKVSAQQMEEMYTFATEVLMLDIQTSQPGRTHLQSLLHRPVRVCGMVKNEGEAGGGPFWVRGRQDTLSLQIVESAQIDPDNNEVQDLVQSSTHFNPVDIVGSLKDYGGNKFDLKRYMDKDAGFISQKSSGGRALKALELPGLWNGAMAGWITLFVEVPASTFSPVKTVNDLLRKEHQPA